MIFKSFFLLQQPDNWHVHISLQDIYFSLDVVKNYQQFQYDHSF